MYVRQESAGTNGRLVLISEHLENVPAGWCERYTYEHAGTDGYHELFALDAGHGYARYVDSRFLRLGVPPPS